MCVLSPWLLGIAGVACLVKPAAMLASPKLSCEVACTQQLASPWSNGSRGHMPCKPSASSPATGPKLQAMQVSGACPGTAEGWHRSASTCAALEVVEHPRPATQLPQQLHISPYGCQAIGLCLCTACGNLHVWRRCGAESAMWCRMLNTMVIMIMLPQHCNDLPMLEQLVT